MADTKWTRGTPIVFSDSGGDVVITLANLLAAAARISARYDQGAGATAIDWEMRATFQMDTAGVIGDAIRVYVSTSDGTNPDGEEGVADAAATVAKLTNMHPGVTMVVDTVTPTVDITASCHVIITSRYFSIVVENATADSLENTAEVNQIVMTPLYPTTV